MTPKINESQQLSLQKAFSSILAKLTFLVILIFMVISAAFLVVTIKNTRKAETDKFLTSITKIIAISLSRGDFEVTESLLSPEIFPSNVSDVAISDLGENIVAKQHIEMARERPFVWSWNTDRAIDLNGRLTPNRESASFILHVSGDDGDLIFYLLVLFVVAAFIALIGLIFAHSVSKKVVPKSLESLNKAITQATGSINPNWSEIKKVSPSEIIPILDRCADLASSIVTLSIQSKLSNLATQVAHDIRSPLSALEMMLSNIRELPEEKRVILRNAINRIRDIANSLSPKGRVMNEELINASNNGIQNKVKNTESVLLSPVIEMIVTEKRLEVRDRLRVHINFDQTRSSYGLFSPIIPNDFKRALSNVINNSVEAFSGDEGEVYISLHESSDHEIQISVRDNGKGIPQEKISTLGIKGNTFSKVSGSGLGLFYAKESIESWGGKLKVESEVGAGTTVSFFLKKMPPPTWFVPKLILNKQGMLVVVDDDQSIHQIWKGRIESVQALGRDFTVQHLSSCSQFRKFYGNEFAELSEATFLIDYEFIDHSETGLDLIELLGIQEQSILVTSRYEEFSLRNRCERMGVKLIPKSMSGFVPIEIL